MGGKGGGEVEGDLGGTGAHLLLLPFLSRFQTRTRSPSHAQSAQNHSLAGQYTISLFSNYSRQEGVVFERRQTAIELAFLLLLLVLSFLDSLVSLLFSFIAVTSSFAIDASAIQTRPRTLVDPSLVHLSRTRTLVAPLPTTSLRRPHPLPSFQSALRPPEDHRDRTEQEQWEGGTLDETPPLPTSLSHTTSASRRPVEEDRRRHR